MVNNRFRLSISVLLVAVVIANGCSSGGGGGGSNTGEAVSGVAAAGAPISGIVYLKDVTGTERSAPTGTGGSFAIDITGLTPPFILKAVGKIGGNETWCFSFSPGSGIANINPLSQLALVKAYGSEAVTTLYNSPNPQVMSSVAAAFPEAITKVESALDSIFRKYGISGRKFHSEAFVANHQGLDLILDLIDIWTSHGFVIVKDKTTKLTWQVPLDELGAAPLDLAAVSMPAPGSVVAVPSSQTMTVNEVRTLNTVVAGTADQRVTWKVVEPEGGSFSGNGDYIAPAVTGDYHVTATNTADPTNRTTVTVQVRQPAATITAAMEENSLILTHSGFSEVAGISLKVLYPSGLTAPAMTWGSFASRGMTRVDPSVPGMVMAAMISPTPVTGSGDLARISFTPAGAAPSGPLSVKVSLIDSHGYTVPCTVVVSNPPQSPPVGGISINGGALHTGFRIVDLTLACTGPGSICSRMKFSHDGIDWTSEELFSLSKTWELSSGTGIKTVFVRFRDAAGNWSAAFSTSIVVNGNSTSEPLLGDMNRNGVIQLDDALATLLMATGSMTIDLNADVNGDAVVTPFDALTLLRNAMH